MKFLVFSDDYGHHPSSCQHIIKRVAKDHQVLWVNTIGMRLPSASGYDLKRIFQKFYGWIKNEYISNEGIVVYSPFMTPFSNITFFRKLNKFLLIRGIRRKCRKHSIVAPVLLTTVPNISDIVGNLGERKVVYYCVDDFTEWPGVLKEDMIAMEKSLLQKTDLLLVTSERLMEIKSQFYSGSKGFLPHGVDIEHFAKAQNKDTKVDPQLDSLSRPILGYFGLIDERLDYSLITDLLSANPEWNVVFIGKCESNITELRKYANFHYLDAVSYDYLPHILKGIDICILPYKKGPETDAISPLKLKECLAAGKPVVSTDIPGVLSLKENIKISSNTNQFIKQVNESLQEDSMQKQEDRVKKVGKESWESRAEKLLARVKEIVIND